MKKVWAQLLRSFPVDVSFVWLWMFFSLQIRTHEQYLTPIIPYKVLTYIANDWLFHDKFIFYRFIWLTMNLLGVIIGFVLFLCFFSHFFSSVWVFSISMIKVTQFGTIFLVFWWMLNEKEWVWCEKNVEVWPRKAASIVNFGFWCFPTSKSSHFTLFWQTNRQPECIHAESHKCIYLERRNHCMSLTVIRNMIFPSCVSLNH